MKIFMQILVVFAVYTAGCYTVYYRQELFAKVYKVEENLAHFGQSILQGESSLESSIEGGNSGIL